MAFDEELGVLIIYGNENEMFKERHPEEIQLELF